MFGYQSPNKSINTAHNGKSVISYYLLPNIKDLVARLQKCIQFSLLDLRSGYHHIDLTLEVNAKIAFTKTSGKWH